MRTSVSFDVVCDLTDQFLQFPFSLELSHRENLFPLNAEVPPPPLFKVHILHLYPVLLQCPVAQMTVLGTDRLSGFRTLRDADQVLGGERRIGEGGEQFRDGVFREVLGGTEMEDGREGFRG
jgi:hypothetical protein